MLEGKKNYKYSGSVSRKFWKRINAIPYSEGGKELYTMGCILQNVEEHVLDELKRHECKRVAQREGKHD